MLGSRVSEQVEAPILESRRCLQVDPGNNGAAKRECEDAIGGQQKPHLKPRQPNHTILTVMIGRHTEGLFHHGSPAKSTLPSHVDSWAPPPEPGSVVPSNLVVSLTASGWSSESPLQPSGPPPPGGPGPSFVGAARYASGSSHNGLLVGAMFGDCLVCVRELDVPQQGG
jgi:hypothetical protein